MSYSATIDLSPRETKTIKLHGRMAGAYLCLDKMWQIPKAVLSLFLIQSKTIRLIKAAEIYEVQEEPALAVDYYLKALVRSPKRMRLHLCLGRCYLRLLELGKSREHIDKFLEKKPDDPEGNLYKGILLYYGAEFREAIEYLKKAEDLLPARHRKTASALEYIGECHSKLNEFPEAIRYMESSLEMDPYHRTARTFMRLGELHCVTGNREKALDFYLAALKLDPDNPEIWNDLGVISHGKGLKEKALDCFSRAVAMRPGFSEAVENLLAVQEELGLHEVTERPQPAGKSVAAPNTKRRQTARKRSS